MEIDPTKNKQANDKYDLIFLNQLTLRLKREPSPSERINADNDSDLVNETLWELICDLYTQIEQLKAQAGVV